MIVYTYMEEQRQNENYCGGDVEIFSIQRDEIAHTKESDNVDVKPKLSKRLNLG